MEQEQIKINCDFLFNKLMEFNPGNFILNPEIKSIQEKISGYQNQCHHSFNTLGVCIYCRKVDPVTLKEA